MFLNPKHSDLLYTVTCSEIHPDTVFKPAVLENTFQQHFDEFQDINPDLVRGYYDTNTEILETNELEEDPWDTVVNESIQKFKTDVRKGENLARGKGVSKLSQAGGSQKAGSDAGGARQFD